MSLKVLLVEDDRELRNTLRDALRVEGYELETAASLAEAQALLAHGQPPDLVLLDLGLPDGEGESLLARLRQQRSIPLLVISARDQDGAKVRLLDAGADVHARDAAGEAQTFHARVVVNATGPAVLDLLGADLMLVEGLLLRSVSPRVYLAPLLSPACVHSAAGVLRLPRTGTQP